MTKGIIRRAGATLLALLCVSVSAVSPTVAMARQPGPGFGRPGDGGLSHGTTRQKVTADEVTSVTDPSYSLDDFEKYRAKASEGKYDEYFLTDGIQKVSIEIDENNLNYMLQNAQDKPYVMSDSVTIGDTTLKYCGLRTKGSYTLEHSATENPGSDRFSFVVNFGKYIKKKDYGKTQNFYGLKKVSFNNFFFDKSMMKEYISFRLMHEMGLPAPQAGLARLYINGEYYGVYAMVESLDTPILEQYLNCDDKELSSYLKKPEDTSFSYKALKADDSPLWENDQDTYNDVKDMLPTVMDWVEKLNDLSEGKDFDGNEIDVNSEKYLRLLSQIMDVDEAVKYFAVHSWLVQIDDMFVEYHNFGLYVDRSGKSLLIPWDYDLSFGTYYPLTAQFTANYNLDVMYKPAMGNMYGGTRKQKDSAYKNFPLFHVIFQNDSLLEKYHKYMLECSQIASLGGKVASTGKTYDPCYFTSLIEGMKDELKAAASEPLSEHVYYMNWNDQPSGVIGGLPNLEKIIAMRSAAVYAQVKGWDSKVNTSGCDLEKVGNGQPGNGIRSGNLISIDSDTGIFVRNDYDSTNQTAPAVTVKETESDNGRAYEVSVSGTPESNTYQITVPLTKEELTQSSRWSVYIKTGDSLKKVKSTIDGNLLSAEVKLPGTVVIKQTGGFVWLAAVIAGLAILAAAVVMIIYRRRGQRS